MASFRDYKKKLKKKHSAADARLFQSFRKEEQRIVRSRRRKRKNPVRVSASVTGKGTGWLPAKAVRIVRGKNGQHKVEVKR